MDPRRIRSVSAGVLLIRILVPSQAVADGVPSAPKADTDEIREVVVTARKREESVIAVPAAVNAISSADLTRYDATTMTEIAQLVPQVIIAKTGGGGAGASLSIRGIGSSPLDAGIDQTVSLNIDGMQISRGRLVTQSFFDVQQVEVLKGPQALFFGKNSPGGVISLKSFGATKDFEAHVQAGYEFNAAQRFTQAAISGPITDTLGFRVAVRASDMAGYIRNDAEPLADPSDPSHPSGGAAHRRDPGTSEVIGRLTLDWRPLEHLGAVLKVLGAKESDNGETAGTELLCRGKPQTLDLLSGTFVTDPNGSCALNGRRSLGAFPPTLASRFPHSKGGIPYTDYKSVVSSLTLSYELENVALTAVTGYYSYDNAGFDNFGYSSAPSIYGYNRDHSDALTQEIRANTRFTGPINLTYGVFYESTGRQTDQDGSIALLPADPQTGQVNNWALATRNHGTTYSAFGQVTYNVLANLELAGGVRWTEDHESATIGNYFVNQSFAPFGLVATQGVFTRGRFKGSNWSPEATVTYHPMEHATLYAGYKTGYKNGGFSNPSILSAGQTAAILGFKPEKAHGGEIGYKQSFLSGRATLSATAYTYTFDDLQLNSFVPNPPSYLVRNAAAARTRGVEFDSVYQASKSLGLRLSGGYNQAKYLNFNSAQCYPNQAALQGCSASGTQNLSGDPLVRAPRFNITAGGTYGVGLSEHLLAEASVDADYTSGYWLQEDENPVSWQGGFYRLNASIRVHASDSAWEVAFIGRNLTNKYYGVASLDAPFGLPDQIVVSIGRSRELMLQGTVRFGAL